VVDALVGYFEAAGLGIAAQVRFGVGSYADRCQPRGRLGGDPTTRPEPVRVRALD